MTGTRLVRGEGTSTVDGSDLVTSWAPLLDPWVSIVHKDMGQQLTRYTIVMKEFKFVRRKKWMQTCENKLGTAFSDVKSVCKGQDPYTGF